MNKFGVQIRKLRASKKLTLRELAEKSGLSYSFIASLEKGRYNPSRESIYSLAKPLDEDVNELLMLAGFLPEESHVIGEQGYSRSSDSSKLQGNAAIEDIMDMPVTFQGKELKKSEKVALLAFLETMSGLKQSK